MTDREFVAKARASWERVVAMQDNPNASTSTLAAATGLWAATNADRLIAIAERNTKDQAS